MVPSLLHLSVCPCAAACVHSHGRRCSSAGELVGYFSFGSCILLHPGTGGCPRSPRSEPTGGRTREENMVDTQEVETLLGSAGPQDGQWEPSG